MNYKKHYDLLIERGQNRLLDSYTENHHIVPRCMGGGDNKENLVRLTPEEHYVAHQLLCKMYPDNMGIAKAVLMMTVKRTNNKIYGWVRKRHSIAMSQDQTGEGNSQFGTRWIHNTILEQSKKIKKNAILPENWIEGRKINFGMSFSEKKKDNNRKKKIQKEIDEIKELKPLYERYVNGEALQNIANDYKYSYVSLYNKMVKHFDFVKKDTGRGNTGSKH